MEEVEFTHIPESSILAALTSLLQAQHSQETSGNNNVELDVSIHAQANTSQSEQRINTQEKKKDDGWTIMKKI